MPKKVEVSIDEVLGTRKDISDDDGRIYKAHVSPRSWNDEERSATFIMSAETEDSYRDIVVQAGIDTKSRFDANPVALFGHRSWGTPIGSWTDVRRINGSPKRTEGKIIFAPEGEDEDADKVARHVRLGTLRAASIGFMPKAAERILDEKGEWNYGYKYLEVELYECSIVTVPAVREALVRAAGTGTKLEDIVQPEVIEEFLEHLKANPALARMINRDLYEDVYREIGGNKSHSILTTSIELDVKSLDRLEAIAGRMEKAADIVSRGTGETIEVVDETEVDEVAKSMEEAVEKALAEVQPSIDEIPEEQAERKGAFAKMAEGIRAIFKSAEPPDEDQPAAANPDVQKALKAEFEEIAAKHSIAA